VKTWLEKSYSLLEENTGKAAGQTSGGDGLPHLHGHITDVNELQRCPHLPVCPQRRPEAAPYLGS
jgi:hypothetical protein